MKIRALATSLFLIVCVSSAAVAQKCFPYDTQIVMLTGRLQAHVFPGPANYESIKQGDRKETALLLTLVKRICTTANDPKFDRPEKHVRKIQLVVRKNAQWKLTERLRGKQVRVTGKLFYASTGHHRTKVLMDVTNIRAA